MTRALNPFKTGLTVGAVLGLWHLGWSALVALGWGQAVVDFVLRLHFFGPVLVVQPFAVGPAAALIALTAAIGFVLGASFAVAWNQFGRGPASS